jgi:hypothetical protein
MLISDATLTGIYSFIKSVFVTEFLEKNTIMETDLSLLSIIFYF